MPSQLVEGTSKAATSSGPPCWHVQVLHRQRWPSLVPATLASPMGCDMAWTFALPLEAALSLRPSNSALEQWGLVSQVAGIQQCSELALAPARQRGNICARCSVSLRLSTYLPAAQFIFLAPFRPTFSPSVSSSERRTSVAGRSSTARHACEAGGGCRDCRGIRRLGRRWSPC